MTARIGGFRSAEDAARYHNRYDALVRLHWPVDHDELDVPTRFGSTHVRRSGPADGTPLVLIHPTTGSSFGWYPVIARLCQRHPVYTPDTVGTAGRSTQTAPINAAADLVAWLDDVLDALEVGRVHILGYSEGGWIAGLHAALTARHERLESLTLIEPSGALERVPARFVAGMIVRGGRALIARDKPRAIRKFNRWMNGDVELTDAQIELLLLAMRTFRQHLPRPERLSDEELRAICTPTLLLMGADTKLYSPAEVAQRAQRLLRDVTIEITPGAGHGLAFQEPVAVTGRILGFLGEQE